VICSTGPAWCTDPGLNEELAATAVMGSQIGAVRPTFRYDGVIGYWYGKRSGSNAPPMPFGTPNTRRRGRGRWYLGGEAL
jgi:hypothetical protein